MQNASAAVRELAEPVKRAKRAKRELNTPYLCPACLSTEEVAQIIKVGEYSILRCAGCRSLVADPIPSPEVLALHYAGYAERYTGGMGRERYEREMDKRFGAKLDLLERYVKADRKLLDLGSADGIFGRMAKQRGFDVTMGDFVPEAKMTPVGPVVPINLDCVNGVPLLDGSFDVVTLWACIEHVRTPLTALRELYRLVKPGGVIAMDTPAVGDWCEENYVGRTHWIAPPEHIVLFSKTALAEVVRKAGFVIEYHAQSFERSSARYLARKGRNFAVAGKGLANRLMDGAGWQRALNERVEQAGDIQLVVARRAHL